MKRIWWQFWLRTQYGESGLFWSAVIFGLGDKSLPLKAPRKTWKKVIILKPLGNPETIFSPGFNDTFYNTKVSTCRRKVKDGPFGMRIGRESCGFFAVSTDALVNLEFVRYVNIGNKKYADRPLY